ncbi:MAG: hypothetical protein KKF41_06985 [Actinobacteria bacterium]|nr:hypothetical protein [Actinomycetota bacterium]MBU1942932.1 hypothetical protein [Actinomycetota bacterium]MBU2687312.1 hypothetical protein [Actinomycetota bacterium]
MDFTLRFWAEMIEPPAVVKRALPLLVEYRAGVAVAVFAGSLNKKNAKAFRAILDAGVELTYWPLLDREDGYFPGESNVDAYAQLVNQVLDWAEKEDVTPDALAIDLELPFGQMRQVLDADNPLVRVKNALSVMRGNLGRERYLVAKDGLRELNDSIQDRGVRTITAVLPWVALELEGEHELIQDMTETPVAGIGWDLLSPMLYVSMLAGMTNGIVTEEDANWLVYDACLRLRSRFGGRAGVSLGLTGSGVLEDEPTFDEPEGLLVGLRAALAAGIRDVSIYNLEGVLDHDDPRVWLDAIRGAKPRVPEKSGMVARALFLARHVYPPVARFAEWYRTPP